MRKTQERFVILDAVCSMKGHFDAETLYRQLEQQSYHVSIATVYNTLELLRLAGIVGSHSYSGRQAKYELLDAGHIHLVCSQCGKVREVHDAELTRLISLRRFGSFTPGNFTIDIFGICASCARMNRKNINHKKQQNSNGKS